MTKNRPNPEKLLKRIQEEDLHEQRGKLKIYLGAAPGVGKTYSMLQDALVKRRGGLDVVLGVVETHGRQEIENLIKNFEVIPPKIISYHGKQLLDFDLEAALKRNPGLILVDEMAHTNASGLRHAKRWQDIKELLDRGIDVYTTLNIQHVESLNDVVAQIIHARVKETVPDSMLALADTIELVDLAPEDLLKRLQEGKVYFPTDVALAQENFFRKGNLIALRELALRTTAERVGAQVLLYREGQGIKHIWPTQQKLLVCVSAGNESDKLIRTTCRIATSLKADWIAVYVYSPQQRFAEERRNKAIQHLRLAEQLGGETRILTGDIIKEIIDFAHEQNITRIVVGKKIQSRWKNFIFSNLTDKIIRASGEIDIHIIKDSEEATSEPLKVMPRTINWYNYIKAVIIVFACTIINLMLYPYLLSSNLIMVYLMGVAYIAYCCRSGASIFAALLSVLSYNFFFIPSFYDFSIPSLQEFFTLVIMFVVGVIISNLTSMRNQQVEAARLAEHHTADLHTLSRQLASTRGIQKLLSVAVRYIGEMFDSGVLALLYKNDHLTIQAEYKSEKKLSQKERGVAQWVYDMGQKAGHGTDTLPFSNALYLPLIATHETIGVLRIRSFHPEHLITPEQMHLLEACAHQIAIALEVDRLEEENKKSELLIESDRARSTLLRSVSHDLRAPLVAAMDETSTFIELSEKLDAKQIRTMGKNIYFELEQLNRLINNLLQINYLEANNVKLHKELYSIDTLVATVIKISNKKLSDKIVNIQIPGDLPLIPLDKVLIDEVLLNLIDNAVKFTPPESPIDITVNLEEDHIIVSIKDKGPGIAPDEVDKLFEKFYQSHLLESERGLGLGLAICQRIIKAHGGKLWAENRREGGAAFRFTLPLS